MSTDMARTTASPKFSLNRLDAYKTARGFLVTLVGAAIPFVAGVYLDWDYTFVVGGQAYDFSLFLTAIIGSVLELGRRWVASNPATE